MHRKTRDEIGLSNMAARALWSIVRIVLFRPSPRPFHIWRCWLLRIFGAKIGKSVRVYQSVQIWAPWNLEMHDRSALGDFVQCYNVAPVLIEEGAVVSQYTFLCTASHDYRDPNLPLVSAPIHVRENAWITADVFVGPGVVIGPDAVVTARSAVFADIPAGMVASGNPATPTEPRYKANDATESQVVPIAR